MSEVVSTKKNSKNADPAGFIFGGMSFFPLFGILFGIVAIIIGAIRRQRGAIFLALGGIAFNVIGYSSLYYFGVVSKTGPFVELKKQGTVNILNQDKGQIAIFQQEHGGALPKSLAQMPTGADSQFFPDDVWGHPLVYKLSPDGMSYTLKSVGPDGVEGTSDDIYPTR